MRTPTRTGIAAVAVMVAGLLLPAGRADAAAGPEILRFWLVDAGTDTRLHELTDYQSLDLPVLPHQLSIEAEASDGTESVVMRIEGALSSTENVAPYALAGDTGGDFVPVPELQVPGWLDVSAEPFAADGAAGASGAEVTLHLYLHQPDFFVTNPADVGDYSPGDGLCSITKPLGLTAELTGPPVLVPAVELPPVARAEPKRPGRADLVGADRFDDLGRVVELPPDALQARPFRTGNCTLRAALEESNALAGNQSVLVDGTRGPFVLSLGQLAITEGITIDGHELPLIDADRSSRVLRIDGGGADIIVNLRGLDLARGQVGIGERGGAIHIDNNAYVQMADSIVRESRANFGGGIYLQNGGDLRMWRSAVRDNVAGTPEDFGGGGVTQRGGGIFNLEGTVHLTDSSIFDNLAVRGGGLSNFGGTIRVENSTVVGNEAVSIGGGIENRDNDGNSGNLHLAFATVAHNTAGTSGAAAQDQRVGGGLYNTARAYVASSILAENTDAWSAGQQHHAPDCYSPTIYDFKSYRHNVVGVLNGNCSLTDYGSGNQGGFEHGTEAAPLDPGLTARFTWDHLAYYNLVASSVALDGGAVASASLYPCPDHDMRGQPRPVGDGCDIGATERQ